MQRRTTRGEGPHLQPRYTLSVQTAVASVSGPSRPSCQAPAGRHGTSGADAGALRPFCIALAPLSYELRPGWGAFFARYVRLSSPRAVGG